MNSKKKIAFVFFLFLFTFTYSQVSTKKCKWIKVSSDELIIEDSLSILPSSLKVSYPADSSIRIKYDINTGKARLGYTKRPDSLLVCYSVFPFKFNKPTYHRNSSLLDSNRYYTEDYYIYQRRNPIETREELFSSPGLNKSGSISRGISFGNNQNVFVNSVLNLQLEGRLTEDISITAAISDQNIPFQPQGNTQTLQEFDKVYIQLNSKNTTVTAGDIVFRNKPSNFLRFYKNVQGGQAEVDFKKDSLHYSSTTAGVAIAKGKFASMLFAKGQPNEPIEGVQGPYRLRGPNGEKFITILANSEKIYIDGALMVRGFDYDYTIDYNQAEVTFTNNRMITQYSVIRMDFEYTERNYSRVILHGSHYQNFKKANAYVNFYQEKDNPRNPLTVSLTDADKEFLSLIGDTLSKAVVSGADSVAFDVNKILYKDSSGIFVYSTDPNLAVFEVSFADVGAGNGRYIQTSLSANGRVFQFVGLGLGQYEPVKQIPTPRKKQMVTVGGEYLFSNSQKAFIEFARSNEDLNLFSSEDDANNAGNSVKLGFTNTGQKVKYLTGYKWTGSIDYEYNAATFVPIDRFRDPNFERDWSSNPAFIADNHIINGSLGLNKDATHNFLYKVSRRLHGADVNGIQNTVLLNQSYRKLFFTGSGFYMFNNRQTENSDWKRASASVSYKIKSITPGVSYAFDKNRVTADSIGRVVSSSMYFDEVKAFFKTNDTLKTRFFGDYAIREDRTPFDGAMVRSTRAQTSNSGFNAKLGNNNEFASTATYRYIEYFNIGGTKLPSEENILGRVDWNSNLLKKHIRSELTLTTGTGRELKRQFIYIPVPIGEGNYYWKDLNEDDIQQLNEFFEAVYTADKAFIKSFIPTDQYLKAYTNTFSYRLDVSAPRNWRDKGKLKSIISRFSNISSWTLNKKITDPDLDARFLPIVSNVPDTNLISVQKAIRSALFFNRSNPKYGLDLNYTANESKQFLTQGFETRNVEDLKFNSRLNVKQSGSLKFSIMRGSKVTNSDFLSARNFNIKSWRFNPEASYQPKNNLRMTLLGSYMIKQNTQAGSNNEKLIFYEGGTELKITKVSQRTINATAKYIRIAPFFNGTSLNSAIGFEMLESLQPGNNFTWNVTWQEKLSNGLQLSFSYEGRKSGSSDIIHIGRMQVSALF